ncbi:hypothetical protein Ais01nite_69080 [Asanoa ishikariensis]|uniref:DUF937 domain-containing protein n=1 Tax=Asanoa ishikariensis TaxID=137265 RepID=A0A1H3N454_9ACTN|nr:YidB family protein [Asanoa ishikariensis]GIF68873.1 hypothetical protein Ais01nite_69080 [Asanoa ishikariensis]SDY83480.1 protein of unknown function [Asanoa ishikariensis]
MDLDEITKLTQNERVRRLLLSVLNRAGDGIDLNRLLDQLQQGGLQQQVQSWIHTSPGREVTGAQISDALGAANLDAAAEAAGMTPDEAGDTLAELLPQVVDRASPGGVLPDATTLQDAFTHVLKGPGLLGEPEPREDHA